MYIFFLSISTGFKCLMPLGRLVSWTKLLQGFIWDLWFWLLSICIPEILSTEISSHKIRLSVIKAEYFILIWGQLRCLKVKMATVRIQSSEHLTIWLHKLCKAKATLFKLIIGLLERFFMSLYVGVCHLLRIKRILIKFTHSLCKIS